MDAILKDYYNAGFGKPHAMDRGAELEGEDGLFLRIIPKCNLEKTR